MNPYYLKINKHLISEQLREYLYDFTINNLSDFTIDYFSTTEIPTGFMFYHNNHLNELDGITNLMDQISLPCFPILVAMHGGTKIKPHIDIKSKQRKCVLSMPIYPLSDYVPTLFWEDINSSDPIDICNYDNSTGCFLNTQEVHSVTNNNYFRVGLQLCFYETFDEVTELFKNGSLF